MTEWNLKSEHAKPGQGELFEGERPAPEGKHRAELLIYLSTRAGFAMVSDFLAAIGAEGDNWTEGACITCWNPRALPNWNGARIYCTHCGAHTVCRAVDIEKGLTPGPVSPRPEGR